MENNSSPNDSDFDQEPKYRPDLVEKERVRDTNITRLVGFCLLLFSLCLGVLGFMKTHPRDLCFSNLVTDFYANISTELASIAITVLIIDYLNERREQRKLLGSLMREMRSEDNGFALRAVVELRAHGWLSDGTLKNAYLRRANLYRANLHEAVLPGSFMQKANLKLAYFGDADLQNTDLREADLTRATFKRANLEGANLQGAILESTKFIDTNLFNAKFPNDQLHVIESLEGSIMPNGELYEVWVGAKKAVD